MFSASYWDPFSGLGSLGFRSDPLFGELRRQARSTRSGRNTTHVDYREGEREYVFSFDTPGLVESDIELDVHGQVLSIRAERKHVAPEGFTAHRVERPSYRIAQSFTLPTRVDVERVTAQLENGVLTVTLPKAAEAHPRRIEVRASTTNPTDASSKSSANEVQS